MKYIIVVECESFEDLKAIAAALPGRVDRPYTDTSSVPRTELPAAPKRGPGRPPKEKAVDAPKADIAEQQAPLTPPTPPSAASDPFGLADEPTVAALVMAKEWTFEEVKNALKELAKTRTADTSPNDGITRVVDVLKKVGVKNVKEIKPEHHSAIMALCGA